MAKIDFDAEIFDDVDFSIQLGFRQAIVRDTVAHDTARLCTFVEDFDVMSFLCQIVGSGQTDRATTDDGDFLAGRCRFFQVGFDVGTTGCDVFHRADENGSTADGFLHAYVFTWGRADEAA